MGLKLDRSAFVQRRGSRRREPGKLGGAYVLLVLILSVPAWHLDAESFAELQQRGIKAFQAGEFAAAERLFSELVQEDPSPEAFSYLATTEGAMGKYRQAIVHFQKSIALGNDTPFMRYNLALSYQKDNQLASAIRELNLALVKNPQFTEARYALGVAQLQAGNPREALLNLKQTQNQLSTKPEMWVNLVHAEFSAGDVKQALQVLDSSVDALPENPRFFVELAEVCLTYGQPQKARELLENANESAPGDNRLKLLLAEVSLQVEEPQEALAVLKDVPPTAGSPGQVDFLRGRASLLQGDLKAADVLLDAAVAADPKSIDYISAHAELQALQKNYEGALASLKAAHEAHPDSPGLAYQTAFICTLIHRYAEAMGMCQEAIQLDPNFDEAYFLLGAIQFEQNEWLPAEAAFRHALALRPRSASYQAALGAALFNAGSVPASRHELDESLTLDPHTLTAYFWRAQLFALQNEPEKAIADLEVFVALDANYREAYEWLVRLYTAEKQTAKAADAQAKYNALEQQIGPPHVPLFLQQLGLLHFLQARGVTK